MNVLTIEELGKNYGVKPLLDSVTFGMADDEKMGLIGANGSGKTTLMRLIAGVEIADTGRVMIPKGARVAYLPQNPEFAADQTVLDAVFDQGDPTLRLLHDYEAASHALAKSDGVDDALLARVSDLSNQLDVTGGWDRESSARTILDRLGISDTAAPVNTLSGGQRKRVALARALMLQPALLLLDEPTNHLDTETIAWLEAYLARYAGALLLVTHDRYFLDRVTNRMLEVRPEGVMKYEGNYTRYLELKEAEEERAATVERTRQNLARRELAWLRRGAKARTSKAKYRVERARALQEGGSGPDSRLELAAASSRLGKKAIEIETISKSYADRVLFHNYSQIISRGDRIGIIGPNGSGKTTFLDIIVGRVAPDSGKLDIGPTVVLGYYDQESHPLDDSLRVIDTVTNIAENVRTADGDLISASQMLDRFLFPPAVQYTPVANLSGGERRRLHLLLVLMRAPNVLLLDEPTNDLDIPTLAALEEYLDTFPGVLIAVSHDRWFLDRTVDQILRFEGDGSIRNYPGGYSAYLARRSLDDAALAASIAAAAAAAKTAVKTDMKTSTNTAGKGKPNRPSTARSLSGHDPGQAKNSGKLSFKEKRELEETERRIEQSEVRRDELESELTTEAADFEAVAALSRELAEITVSLERDVERWAELAERS